MESLSVTQWRDKDDVPPGITRRGIAGLKSLMFRDSQAFQHVAVFSRDYLHAISMSGCFSERAVVYINGVLSVRGSDGDFTSFQLDEALQELVFDRLEKRQMWVRLNRVSATRGTDVFPFNNTYWIRKSQSWGLYEAVWFEECDESGTPLEMGEYYT